LYPRWSPDGQWIAFQRGDSVRFDVFVAPASGGTPRQVTHENNMMSGFAWLPDGTGLVYSSSHGESMPYLPALGLWQVTLSDGTVRRVTSGEASYVSPDISKSGAMVVGRMKLQTDIWKFPADGTPVENVRRGVRLTRQTGQVLTPTAGPGDKEVAFLSDSGGHANLWVVNTESGALRQITHEREPGAAVGVTAAPSRSFLRAATRDSRLASGWWTRTAVTCATSRTPALVPHGRQTAAGCITRRVEARQQLGSY
jgi:tricorn protease